MASQPDPTYDLQGAVETLMPGVVVQRQLLDAAAARYAAIGYTPLSSSDVATILANANSLDPIVMASQYAPTTAGTYATALPSYPTGMPRWQDSNPSSFDDWSKDQVPQVALF